MTKRKSNRGGAKRKAATENAPSAEEATTASSTVDVTSNSAEEAAQAPPESTTTEADAEPPKAGPAVASGDDNPGGDPTYRVAPGRSITSKKGILGPGAEVKPEYVSGGTERLDELVEKGALTRG